MYFENLYMNNQRITKGKTRQNIRLHAFSIELNPISCLLSRRQSGRGVLTYLYIKGLQWRVRSRISRDSPVHLSRKSSGWANISLAYVLVKDKCKLD